MQNRRTFSNVIDRPRCETYDLPCLSDTKRCSLLGAPLDELAAERFDMDGRRTGCLTKNGWSQERLLDKNGCGLFVFGHLKSCRYILVRGA